MSVDIADSAKSSVVSRRSRPETISLKARIRGLLEKGLKPAEVARVLKEPYRTVSYHAKRMGRDFAEMSLPKRPPVSQIGKVWYRPHDFIISLPIHWASDGYRSRLRSRGGNQRRFRGHFVQFSRKTVVVNSAPGLFFEGVDQEDALGKAREYFFGDAGLVKRIERQYGVVLLKRDCEFSWSWETGEVGNELAGDFKKHRERVSVKDPEDGTTWLHFDMSPDRLGFKGLGEAETSHRVTAREDMGRVVAPFFNDLRDNMNYLRLPSEEWRMHSVLREDVQRLSEAVAAISGQLSAVVELQRAQVAVVSSLLPKRVDEVAQGGVDGGVSELRRYTG